MSLVVYAFVRQVQQPLQLNSVALNRLEHHYERINVMHSANVPMRFHCCKIHGICCCGRFVCMHVWIYVYFWFVIKQAYKFKLSTFLRSIYNVSIFACQFFLNKLGRTATNRTTTTKKWRSNEKHENRTQKKTIKITRRDFMELNLRVNWGGGRERRRAATYYPRESVLSLLLCDIQGSVFE